MSVELFDYLQNFNIAIMKRLEKVQSELSLSIEDFLILARLFSIIKRNNENQLVLPISTLCNIFNENDEEQVRLKANEFFINYDLGDVSKVSPDMIRFYSCGKDCSDLVKNEDTFIFFINETTLRYFLNYKVISGEEFKRFRNDIITNEYAFDIIQKGTKEKVIIGNYGEEKIERDMQNLIFIDEKDENVNPISSNDEQPVSKREFTTRSAKPRFKNIFS